MINKIAIKIGWLQKEANKNESDSDLTPMLDVVFIVLIFFVVTASFVKEVGIGLNKPEPPTKKAVTDIPIVIQIDRNNQVFIQNKLVSRASIQANIIRLKSELPNAAVIINLDPKSKTETMIAAVDAVRAAKIEFPALHINKT